MNHPKAVFGLLAVFFGCLSSPVNAQINLKTGYNISFFDDRALNDLISDYNQTQSFSNPFNELRWLHGFEAGFRLKGAPHALELTYTGVYQSLRATSPNPSGGAELIDKLRFNVQSAGAGYQLSDKGFGVGADLQYQWYITKAEITEPVKSIKNVQKMWAAKFYLMLIFEGSGNVSLVLEPYLILPTETYDPKPLQSFLEIGGDRAQNKWTRFGLSILFYNGNPKF